jgi:hypothetical protein
MILDTRVLMINFGGMLFLGLEDVTNTLVDV